MKRCLLLAMVVFLFGACASSTKNAKAVSALPVQGRVTLVDIGAALCLPCKQMLPILKELQEEYRDKVSIVIIDIWENEEESRQFEFRTIPTQILYDESGREVFRHEGFLGKESIREELRRLGVE